MMGPALCTLSLLNVRWIPLVVDQRICPSCYCFKPLRETLRLNFPSISVKAKQCFIFSLIRYCVFACVCLFFIFLMRSIGCVFYFYTIVEKEKYQDSLQTTSLSEVLFMRSYSPISLLCSALFVWSCMDVYVCVCVCLCVCVPHWYRPTKTKEGPLGREQGYPCRHTPLY